MTPLTDQSNAMIKKSILLVPALCLPLLLSTATYAGKFYKWVDEAGVTHYGEQPPNTESASVINVKTGASSDQDKAVAELEAKRQAKQDAKDANTANADQNQQQQELEKQNREIMQKNCAARRQNLAQLKLGGRIKVVSETGEPRYLSDDEIAQRKSEAEKYLEENCKDF